MLLICLLPVDSAAGTCCVTPTPNCRRKSLDRRRYVGDLRINLNIKTYYKLLNKWDTPHASLNYITMFSGKHDTESLLSKAGSEFIDRRGSIAFSIWTFLHVVT